MKTEMHFACATDDAYVPWCGIMLTSLREHHMNETIHVHILATSLSDESIRVLNNLQNEMFFLNVIITNDIQLSNFPIRNGDHVSLATYCRLFLPEYLPETLDKVVYLDCDVIVVGSLVELWNLELENHPCAAVIDEASHTGAHSERCGFDASIAYFNAGVILVNLNYWRKWNCQKILTDYVVKDPDRCKFHDQDALNGVFFKKWIELPLCYNLQTGFLTQRVYDSLPSALSQLVNHAVANRKIIHFTGPGKPWLGHSRHPFRDSFLKYKNMSLWAELPLVADRRPPSIFDLKSIKSRINGVLVALHLKRHYKTYIDIEQ